MAISDLLGSVKDIFVVGRNNSYLHGRQRRQETRRTAEPQEMSYAPQPAMGQQPAAQYYPQQDYQAPAWQPPQQQPARGYGQYVAPETQPYPQQQRGQQAPYAAQPVSPYQRPEHSSYQTQFSPEPARDQQRNRRSQQHQEPAMQMQENVVPFPSQAPAQAPIPQETQRVDVYVVNVFNMVSCRQAVNMLRKGHCTLVVTDQLVDKAEVRHYVDILSGACFALNGSIIRLSAKVGFYVMAPAGMMVYMDSAIAGANQQLRTPPAQAFQPPIAAPQAYQAPDASYAPQQTPYQPTPEELQQAPAQYAQPQPGQSAGQYAYGVYPAQSQAL